MDCSIARKWRNVNRFFEKCFGRGQGLEYRKHLNKKINLGIYKCGEMRYSNSIIFCSASFEVAEIKSI